MALTVQQLFAELTTAEGKLDPEMAGALILVETDEGYRALDEGSVNFHRSGPPDAESTLPVLVIGDGGSLEID